MHFSTTFALVSLSLLGAVSANAAAAGERRHHHGGHSGGHGGFGQRPGSSSSSGSASSGSASGSTSGAGSNSTSTTGASTGSGSTGSSSSAGSGSAAGTGSGSGTAVGTGGNGAASSSGGSGGSTTLSEAVICTGCAQDGLNGNGTSAGEVASLTSTTNFINFCDGTGTDGGPTGLPITNGIQISSGSCNPIPMGVIASTNNMPSAKITNPANLATIPANTNFTATIAIKNLETGNFVNADQNYYSAPCQVNGNGDIIGHSHLVIQAIDSLTTTKVSNPQNFAFFKGLNAAAENGVLSVDVTALPAGTYTASTINTCANHQPVLVAFAQHARLDDTVYFTVADGGNAGGNGNGNAGSGAASSSGAGNAGASSGSTASTGSAASGSGNTSGAGASSGQSSSGQSSSSGQASGNGGGRGGFGQGGFGQGSSAGGNAGASTGNTSGGSAASGSSGAGASSSSGAGASSGAGSSTGKSTTTTSGGKSGKSGSCKAKRLAKRRLAVERA